MLIALLAASAFIFALATTRFLTRLVRFELPRAPLAEGAMALGTALLLGAAVLGFDPAEHQTGGALSILFLAVAASGTAMVILRWGDFPLVGPVTSSLVGVVALALALRTAFPEQSPPGPMRLVTILHISATMVGFLLFTPAFVLGNLYLAQSWRLKTKQPSSTRLPPLVTLETTAWRLLTVGFVLYTLGIVGGWLSSSATHPALRPAHIVAATSWLIYAVAILRRYTSGWSGTRAAVALLAGFVTTSGAVLLYVMR
jgi:ABC-type uncharacterized transport system permease subunit